MALGLALLTIGAGLLGWRLGGDLMTPVGRDAGFLSGFRFPTLDGERLGPPDFKGQVVVLDFWATWCTPCRAQARILEQVRSEYPPEDVSFLAISVNEERETVAGFLRKNPGAYTYPVVVDTDGASSSRGGVHVLPTVLVLDLEGEVVFESPGVAGADEIRDTIDDLLAAPRR